MKRNIQLEEMAAWEWGIILDIREAITSFEFLWYISCLHDMSALLDITEVYCKTVDCKDDKDSSNTYFGSLSDIGDSIFSSNP